MTGLTPVEKAKVKFDLAIISVLLDACAGANWQYKEFKTNLIFISCPLFSECVNQRVNFTGNLSYFGVNTLNSKNTKAIHKQISKFRIQNSEFLPFYNTDATGHDINRSEGLAIFSFRLFCQGFFSSNPNFPYQVDAKRLSVIEIQTLAPGFQVSTENPLVGLKSRLQLLQHLGKVLEEYPSFFGTDNPRPGNMVDYFLANQTHNKTIKATAILEGLGEIWPGHSTISGINLGDVWPNSRLKTNNLGNEYIPFHKLSQWLTYSLLESLQELGLKIIGLGDLTGLAEYRNGGLFIDMELIKVKNPLILQQQHLPSSEILVK